MSEFIKKEKGADTVTISTRAATEAAEALHLIQSIKSYICDDNGESLVEIEAALREYRRG